MKTKSNTSCVEVSVRFGEWLVDKKLIKPNQLTKALREQRRKGGRLGEVLLDLKIVTDQKITRALAKYLSIDYTCLDDLSTINMDIARSIPGAIAKRFCLVAIGEEDDKIIVAMADPLNVVVIDTVTLKLKRRLKPVISSVPHIQRAIEKVYHGSDIEEQQLRELVEVQADTANTQEEPIIQSVSKTDVSDEAGADDTPVIRFVNLLLTQAIKSRASDIHIEPRDKSMSVRMRVDGVLHDMVPPAPKMQSAVVTRMKIISEMDIAEHRLPQDGRFKMKVLGREIDMRVSAIPTIYGEKIVTRILDKTATSHELVQLCFEPELLEKFKMILAQPHGIIIVTGPTGSGKSTTLYSALNYLNDPRKNITTVEDPIEYRLKGINQIQTKAEIDLDFAVCLKAILRQDPDIILIGEIRDKETMEIAMKASLTGHLVLSSFHTNDAPGALSRLMYMGLEPYLLASSLNLVVAQRLVRKICEKCKEPVKLDTDVLNHLGISSANARGAKFSKGRGCENCDGTGYYGRLPIFEFLVLDKDIREKLVAGASETEIRTMARKKGYGGLLDSGAKKIINGLTTPEEVLGVTFSADDIV